MRALCGRSVFGRLSPANADSYHLIPPSIWRKLARIQATVDSRSPREIMTRRHLVPQHRNNDNSTATALALSSCHTGHDDAPVATWSTPTLVPYGEAVGGQQHEPDNTTRTTSTLHLSHGSGARTTTTDVSDQRTRQLGRTGDPRTDGSPVRGRLRDPRQGLPIRSCRLEQQFNS